MNHVDDFSDQSAEFLCKILEIGNPMKTNVDMRPERTGSAAGTVILRPPDRFCSECGDLLGEYGPNAEFKIVAPKIKRRYGETYCKDCHDPSQRSDS